MVPLVRSLFAVMMLITGIVACSGVGVQNTSEREMLSEQTTLTETNDLWKSGRKMVEDGEKAVRAGRLDDRQPGFAPRARRALDS